MYIHISCRFVELEGGWGRVQAFKQEKTRAVKHDKNWGKDRAFRQEKNKQHGQAISGMRK